MPTMAAIQSVEQVDKVSLKVLVDKERSKVLFAEAGKDFVDVLFSFLTLPLGTIARLVAQESNIEAVRVGSLSSLYQSVVDLKEEHLWTPTCKEMLMKPRNSMESYCRQLKLNIDHTEPVQYFICENWGCSRRESGSLLSTFRNQTCSCGKVMDRELSQPECLNLVENGFVEETATFIICDDLCVMPNVLGTSVHLLQNLGVHNIGANIEEQTVDISKKEVVDILKLSLLSNSPLTDFIFKRNQFLDSFNPRNQSEIGIGEVPSDEGRQMSVKVMVRKSTREILYAYTEAVENFADFLFSFLTFPLGGVLHMLQGFSSLSCMENLYKSMTKLSSDICLRSQVIKDKLTKPKIAPQFELSNQILPIGAASLPVCYFHTYRPFSTFPFEGALTTTPMTKSYVDEEMNAPLKLVDPKFCISKSSSSGEFARGPSMFMVTDDLVVTPVSSLAALSYLNRSNIPLSDLEEKVVTIGPKEGLSILKALLISTSALKIALKGFI